MKNFVLSLIVLLIGVSSSYAHTNNYTYVYLRIYENSMEGRFEISTAEINRVLNLNLELGITTEQLAPYVTQIQDYYRQHTAFSSAQGKHALNFTEVDSYGFEGWKDYVVLHFTYEGLEGVPDYMDIFYNAIIETDPTHRAWVVVEYHFMAGIIDNEANPSLSFGTNDNQQRLEITDFSVYHGIWATIKSGVWHIWIGLDHIAFLIALLLPSVISRNDEKMTFKGAFNRDNWQVVPKFRPAGIYVLKIVTFFTVSHTITLSLAALDVVSVPSRLIESIIAISIGMAALHNIFPIAKDKEWWIAFFFGLFHGFGFASVLGDLGLGDFMVSSLFGFNVGVEIGQVAIIAIVFPVLYLLKSSRYYPLFLVIGSLGLIFISCYWLTERVFDIELPLGLWFYEFRVAYF